MKKQLSFVLIFAMLVVSLFPLTAAAQNKNFSFSVSPSVNSGKAWSAGNPKNDNERASYVHTQTNNIIASDRFYYNVKRAPSNSGTSMTGRDRCYGNGKLTMPFLSGQSAGTGTSLYLEADTDVYSVQVSGYWYS